MRRRDTIQLLAGAAASIAAPALWAQPARRTFRIGVVSQTPRPYFTGIPTALRELGYEEGREFVLEYRLVQERAEELSARFADLVAAKVDLILAGQNTEILAAKGATTSIPIVMMYAIAPIESGFVASFARPGGNITGIVKDGPDTAAKKLELLREAVPGVSRVTLLWGPALPGLEAYRRSAERAAQALGMRLTALPCHTLAELEAAFAGIAQSRPDALYVVPDNAIFAYRARVIEFAARQRLPAIYTGKFFMLGGGLIAHAPVDEVAERQIAAIIKRILSGEKAGAIALQQPDKYALVVNLKTAKTLGIDLPPSLVSRADEVFH